MISLSTQGMIDFHDGACLSIISDGNFHKENVFIDLYSMYIRMCLTFCCNINPFDGNPFAMSSNIDSTLNHYT